jgi:hypothetical protein
MTPGRAMVAVAAVLLLTGLFLRPGHRAPGPPPATTTGVRPSPVFAADAGAAGNRALADDPPRRPRPAHRRERTQRTLARLGEGTPTAPPEHVCGDGVLDPGEECDGAPCADGRDCLQGCTCDAPNRCGNGTVDPGEQCDGADDRLCPGDCQDDCRCPGRVLCGNGVLDPGEECDGGPCPGGEPCSPDCECPQ